MSEYQPQQSPAWQTLSGLVQGMRQQRIIDLFAAKDRVKKYSIEVPGIFLDYSKHLVDDQILAALLQLAQEANVPEKLQDLYHGKVVNPTEAQPALHLAMRHPSMRLSINIRQEIDDQKAQLARISTEIRTGAWLSATGKPITDLVNLGIGGSDLGVRMATVALREVALPGAPACHFLANVDGAEVNSLLAQLPAETSLIIISSKSFRTPETLLNAKTCLAWLGKTITDPHRSPQCLAITANYQAALEFGIPEERIITVPEAIGGRYSLWSGSSLALSISIGYDAFAEMLAGAAAMDAHCLQDGPLSKMPVILGLLGIWYNNFLQAQSHAVIPYCQRLELLVPYLQQLEMESNGKSATLAGEPLSWATSPVLWGQTGTNGQHAFFQMLHQGTRLVPIDFIGIVHAETSPAEHQRMLLSNMIAQSAALMRGRSSPEQHRHYPGNRPSSTLLLDELTPYKLGMLLALYEHKVFVQSVIWDINPFDQWGVELGKQLATALSAADSIEQDASTNNLISRTGLFRSRSRSKSKNKRRLS